MRGIWVCPEVSESILLLLCEAFGGDRVQDNHRWWRQYIQDGSTERARGTIGDPATLADRRFERSQDRMVLNRLRRKHGCACRCGRSFRAVDGGPVLLRPDRIHGRG